MSETKATVLPNSTPSRDDMALVAELLRWPNDIPLDEDPPLQNRWKEMMRRFPRKNCMDIAADFLDALAPTVQSLCPGEDQRECGPQANFVHVVAGSQVVTLEHIRNVVSMRLMPGLDEGWADAALKTLDEAIASPSEGDAIHVEVESEAIIGKRSSKAGFYTLSLFQENGPWLKLRLSDAARWALRDLLLDSGDTEQASGDVELRSLLRVILDRGDFYSPGHSDEECIRAVRRAKELLDG